MFDPVMTWLDGVSGSHLVAATVIFIAIVAAAFWSDKPAKLDGRLRGMVEPNAKNAGGQNHGPSIADPLRWLASRTTLIELQKTVLNWLWEHSSVGEKKQLQLKQAGLRGQRVYLYFEITRVALGGGLTILTYLVLQLTGLFSLNPALSLVVLVFALVMGLYLPEIYLKQRIKARRRQFEANWDDAIGLLIICLDAGLSIEVALRRIARELAPTAPVLAEELIISVTDLSLLKERRLAYLNLAERIDLPSVQSVTVALIQSEKQGASIAGSLRTLSQANRQSRISRAEEKAAALGPKMTVPMILFFLPVVFVIIIAPIFLKANT